MTTAMAQSVGTARRGGLLQKFATLLLATLMTVLLLDWGVGRFFPVGGQIYVASSDLLHDAAPNAARIQPMNASYVHEGDSTRVRIRTGAEGYRGGDLKSPKAGRRVLVIGDSLVMAENVPLASTFVRSLGRELEARLPGGGSIEMVNAGRSGYGVGQSLLLLERDAELVEPDLIVCVICAHNDFGDLMRNKLFRLDDSGALVRETPVLGERMRKVFEVGAARGRERPLRRLWRFWRTAQAPSANVIRQSAGAMRTNAMALEAQAREFLVAKNHEVVTLFEDVYDIDMAAPQEGGFFEAKRDLMTAVLARMVRFAAVRQVPILFVVVPSAVDVCDEFGVRVDPLQFPKHVRTHLVEALMGCVGLAGGVAIDVTPTFVGQGPADRYFVGGTDMHWNAAGQGAAASYVAEELLGDTQAAAALGADVVR